MNMKKFSAYIRIGIVDGLEYRFQLTYWLYLNMIPILLMLYLWATVYQEKEMIGKYSLNMMITYYVVTKLINRFTTTYSEGRIAKDIKDGNLNQFLTRPMNYSMLKFGERLGIRLVNAAIFVPLYGIIIVLLQKYFVMPVDFSTLTLITANILVSIISAFLMARILGFTAFFMLETHALFGLKDHIISLLSGFMFPLFLFPQWLEKILMLLPFPYYYYFPMEIYFGHLGANEIAQGFAIQAIWIFLLFFLGEFLWKKGIKNYEAIGI